MNVLLGFEVGTGQRVEIPLAHTFVTGQTQLSGKTTTLRAIVERSGQRALAFVTKRGEQFAGRRIRPYLPREGEEPIHWRLVETILASALGQRAMKYERLWLVNAVKRPRVAKSLQAVRDNVSELQGKAKGNSADAYLLIGEYLDLVLPDMRALNAGDVLELQPGLNVMDITDVGQQLQALVIRAALERINKHETGVLTVFPEAWEFAPRALNSPAKDAAIAMARKGAVLGNFLLCDSQDIAGVDTVVRQAASVWILGVQRELNELKRTIQTIPAGIKRPKPEDVAHLEVGQFFACWGRHAVKVYVMPAGMSQLDARAVALGTHPRPRLPEPAAAPDGFVPIGAIARRALPGRERLGVELEQFVGRGRAAQAAVDGALEQIAAHGPGLTFGELAVGEIFEWPAPIPPGPEPMVKASEVRYEWSRGTGTAESFYRVERVGARAGSDVMNAEQERKFDQKLDRLVTSVGELAAAIKGWATAARPEAAAAVRHGEAAPRKEYTVGESLDNEALYQAIKRRLIEEAARDPQILEVLVRQPELRVKVERHTVSVDGDTLQGRLARFILKGFFEEPKTLGNAFAELQRIGFKTAAPNVSKELTELSRMGFLTRDNKWYRVVESMKGSILEV